MPLRMHAAATPVMSRLQRGVGEAAAVVRDSALEWWRSDALQLGAALAYYTMFSLAPLLIVAIGVAGLVLGEDAARAGVVRQLDSTLGRDASQAIAAVVEKASLRPDASTQATLVGLATILVGATGVFGQLQWSLNRIWNVEPPAGGFADVLKRRAVSFGTVLLIGVLLMASLLAAAAIAAIGAFVPEFASPAISLARFGASFAIEVLLFAALFKMLPDCDVAWSDVWVGAAVTALLFEIGKSAIAFYLGRAGVVSMYGAAGSFVALLLWVYYSAQILFLGAAFTQVWTRRRRGDAGAA